MARMRQASPVRGVGHVSPGATTTRGEERGLPTRLARAVVGHTYWLLSLALSAVVLYQLSAGPWLGDFWEHAAVVRELIARPFAPGHPILASDVPHAFYSPYSLVVALAARLAGGRPIGALECAAVVNWLLLLVSLRWLVGALRPGNADRVAFYCLLFVVLLWGRSPWTWSGFLHGATLAFVLPYPSTAAAAGLFAAWALPCG